PVGVDGKTNVWGYQGTAIVKGNTLAALGYPADTTITGFVWSPSATFEAVRGTPVQVTWVNMIDVPQPFAVDPTLQWANPMNAFPDGDIFSQEGTYPIFPPGFDGTVIAGNPLGLNAQSPVPLVPHLHGAEVPSEYDGGPDAWWTSATTNKQGTAYRTVPGIVVAPGAAVYSYNNLQEPNTLWYHDHALGITRINVMSGLAGFYYLREPVSTPVTPPITANNLDQYLTQTFLYGVSDIPLAIQDRTFKLNGELWFPEVGLNINTHPYWMPEFFGDTIMVNGLVWPNLDVTPGWYRFHLLDGSNARFYTITLKDQITGNKIPFILIGADGGYLQAPVTLKEITFAPGDRLDILVDFSAIAPGTTIIMENKAKTPFPAGAQPDPQTTGRIMQFTVKTSGTAVTQGVAAIQPLPVLLNPTLTPPAPPAAPFPTLPAPPTANRRFITLNEVMGLAGPLSALINGQYYQGTVTETPTLGSTEEWYIINLTGDTHPIHTHLASSQLVSRQKIDVANYLTAWLALNSKDANGVAIAPPFPKDYTPKPLDPTLYLKGKVALPTPTEMGWTDTEMMHPGEVTVIRIRFTQQNGAAFPFDPTTGAPGQTLPPPGYVYHCHILDHEDNEMMRPLKIMAAP
ncbi:MAG: multicopper oxidase domain-containing protein, partial [Dehalococcoidia bacterium]|nr:multicopper oxidase domain-containing protein [Dehalococcoidia bacterium]